MKQWLFTTALVVWTSVMAACDACGCGISGDGWGLTPYYNRDFFGIRPQYRHFMNQHPSIFEGNSPVTGEDHFLRTDLLGRWNPGKRWQLAAQWPWIRNERFEDDQHTIINGWGDLSAQVQFLPVLPGCADWKHAVQISFGAELPTGRFTMNHDIPVTMQTGSGSWDVLTSFSYALRYRNAGMAIDMTQRFNGYSRDGYDWGNAFIASAKLFYTWSKQQESTLIPWVALSAEQRQPDIENMDYGTRADYSGGHLAICNFGLDYFNGRYSLGCEAGIPVVNDLADGHTQLKTGLGLRLLVFIHKKRAPDSLQPS
ncbi:MAG: hypothetical protein JNM00_13125 [Flavobacteriales bacterium]|nr:hypothetical protein [Flavobacteriales bacterium]